MAGEADAVPRTPLIAGNWKMHKTEAEAEEYIQALLPRVRGCQRRRGRASACRSPSCARWSTARAARASRSSPRTCTRSPRAPSPARSRRRCWPSSTCAASCWATPSAAQLFGETDRALALKVPAALEAGLAPILCVGETEERARRGDTERKLRQQVQDELDGVPDERLGEVAIAYEPIWAIGTGEVATPEQAQEAIAFVRALVGDRAPAAGRGRCACSTAARSTPRTPPSCSRCPTSTARSSAAPRWSAEAFAAIVRARACGDLRSCRPASVWSCSTAGASPRPGPATPSRSPARRSSTSSGNLPAHHADRLRPRRRAARGADGQLRGRPPQPRRRRGRPPGPDAHRRRRRATACWARTPRSRRARGPERVHLIGLVSDGGVHSSLEHLQALVELAGRLGARIS